MDRRGFIKSSASAAALAAIDFPALAAMPGSRGRCRLKLGILVDVLVRNRQSRDCFVKALEYFRDDKVDAVMIAGDLI